MQTNNFLIINKPKYCTSFDVVNFIKKKYNFKKVGHAGTLDPLATGVLVLAINDDTKQLSKLILEDKEYIVEILFGVKTDSFDLGGKIIDIKKTNINLNQINNSIVFFNKKEYLQEVPIFSATKVNGKKLYEYGRKNQIVELPKKNVKINEINLITFDEFNQILKLRLNVSKGFYIRSFSQELANNLNVIAVVSELIRTKSGNFSIEKAIDIDLKK